MKDFSLPESLSGIHVHFVGAKGTGMTALAELFSARGAILSGSDVPDVFYTDAILRRINMKVHETFDPANLGEDTRFVIYSDAYNKTTNPELIEAGRRALPCMSFAEALGVLSRLYDSSGIAGVHGKTTTTAMTGTILGSLECPATILAGSAVSNFGDSCTLIKGDTFFVAETDEYRRHFMHFSPRRILLTSVESDHQDYFPTYDDILRAYFEYAKSLPREGELIYCADDPGAVEVAEHTREHRPDVALTPYGFKAQGMWRIEYAEMGEGESRYKLELSTQTFALRVPGAHLVLDSVGALALAYSIMTDGGRAQLKTKHWALMRQALAGFKGSRRRSEIIGEAGGVLVMDDYAHHPTALKATIHGIKEFWPSRRIIVDFMSHTFSRTAALMDEFAESLDEADALILHEIYSSAREHPMQGVSGKTLFEKVKSRREGTAPAKRKLDDNDFLLYFEKHADAADTVMSLLRPNDLFITMGAGDNWKLGRTIFERLGGREKEANNV